MPYTFFQAASPAEMTDLLNGVVHGGLIQLDVLPDGTEVIRGLNGLTLIFTTPLVTVTFATADPIPLADALNEINTQVQIADANFIARTELAVDHGPGNVDRLKKRFIFQTDTAAGINLTGGTGRDQLGFTSDKTAAPTVSTDIVAGGDTISGGVYIILAP